MKLLFLDIDGVLNIMSSSYYTPMYRRQNPIEPHLVRRLEFILGRSPDAHIVVSSSWGLDELKHALELMKFRYLDRIIDRTDRSSRYRGDQIASSLKKYDCKTYVVLEDEIDDVCGSICDTIDINKVVEVNMHEGLSHDNCVNTIKILNNITESKVYATELTIETYSTLYDHGYRAQVKIPCHVDGSVDFDTLLDRFNTMDVIPKDLTMLLRKEEVC